MARTAPPPQRLLKPPSGYRGAGIVPSSGDIKGLPLSSLGLGLPAPIPPPSAVDMERITGKTHLSLYNQRAAEREYDAWTCGESYVYQTPPTDADGYLLFSQETDH